MVSLKMTHSYSTAQSRGYISNVRLFPNKRSCRSPSECGGACNLTSFPDLTHLPPQVLPFSLFSHNKSNLTRVCLCLSCAWAVPQLCLSSDWVMSVLQWIIKRGPTQEMQRNRADGWVTSNIAFWALVSHSQLCSGCACAQHNALLCTLGL